MTPTRKSLDRANVYNDEAQAHLVDQAVGTLDAEVRRLVRQWLDKARDFFPTGTSAWSLSHVRQHRLPIRQATEDLAHQLASVYIQVVRTARRTAFARAYQVAKAQQEALLKQKPDPIDVMADAGAVTIQKATRESDAGACPKAASETPNLAEAGSIPAPSAQRQVARTLILEPDGRIYVLVWPNGEVQLPGGKVEAGESLEDAAVREAHEEAGLRVSITGWLCDMSDQYAKRSYYLAAVDRGLSEAENIDPDGNLLVNVELVSAEQAVALLTSPYDKAAVETYLVSLQPKGTHDGVPASAPRLPPA